MTESAADQPCCPPAKSTSNAPLKGDEAEAELAQMAQALGHPIRVAILRLLLEHRQCICGELVDELPVAQSTVSQHLKKLKQAKLIRGTIDGPRVCYCIEPSTVERFQALFGAILAPENDDS